MPGSKTVSKFPTPGQAAPGHATDVRHDAAKTLTAFLREYGAHAFDIPGKRARDVREECERWSRKIETWRDGLQGDAQFSTSRADFAGLIAFVQEQRRSESSFFKQSKTALSGALLDFARNLRAELGSSRQAAERTQPRLAKLEVDLRSSDSETVAAAAADLAKMLRAELEERERAEACRLELLRDQVRALKQQLTEPPQHGEVDVLTGLETRHSFNEQASFLCSLAGLTTHPPTLVLINVDRAELTDNVEVYDAALRNSASALLRRFITREEFVARFAANTFALILLDVDANEGVSRGELARSLVADSLSETSLSASAAIATLLPTEEVADWISRCEQGLAECQADGGNKLRRADLVAEFL